MNELKPCPFCGSKKLRLEKKSCLIGYNGLDWRVEQHTFTVRCNVCHARGGTSGGKVIPHYEHFVPKAEFQKCPDWATHDNILENDAIAAWNRRTDRDGAR